MRTEYSHGDSLRIVTTHVCNESCVFCHNEGNPNFKPNAVDVETTLAFAEEIRDKIGLNTIHLTGGEPTLHPQITELIAGMKSTGFRVQMTTNGDWNPIRLDEFVKAGIDSLNFSINGITPDDLFWVMGSGKYGRGQEWCTKMVARKQENLRNASMSPISTKINTVVMRSDITSRVLDFALTNKLPIRMMRNLNDIENTEEIIQRLLREKGLTPIINQIATGDSGGAGTLYGYRDYIDQPDVRVKRFGDVYLESICTGCPLKGTEKCREKFYGVRFGKSIAGEHEVRLCIDRNDGEVVMPMQDFLRSNHINSLQENYL